jgi:hypothetical protein
MPQATLEEGFQATGEATIKSALPGWVIRDCATAVHYPGKTPTWRVGFRCDCRKAKDYVTVKSEGKVIKQVAAAAHDQIEAKHGTCNGQTTAPAPSKREAELQDEVRSSAKRLKTLQREVSATDADKGAAAKLAAAATTTQRLTTTAARRRKEINRNDTDSRLEPTDLHNAVHGKGDPMPKPGGLFHCVTYWARGSIGIVFQLIMALITQFGLEDN